MAATVTRKRFRTFRSGKSVDIVGAATNIRDISVVGKQETVSARYPMFPTLSRQYANLGKSRKEAHDADYWRRHYRNLDWGNEFWTSSHYYKDNSRKSYSSFDNGPVHFNWNGTFFAATSVVVPTDNLTWPAVPDRSTQTLACFAMGGTAIARTVPTSPVAQTANFMGELFRDGVPSIIGATMFKDRSHFFKSLGSEYLNIEFGWKPFINDLLKFAHAVKNAESILSQLERDSGRGIRRKYRFPSITSTVITPAVNSGVSPAINSLFFDVPIGKRTKTRVSKTDYWFSAEYRYYVDMGVSTRSRIRRCAQEAEKLFGLRITPEVLWNLAPWSWLVDWFGNVGDMFANISRFGQDGLQMRYGYVMCQTDISETYSLTGVTLKGGRRLDCSQTFGSISKIRCKASPYGFGLNPDTQFSARQWAILAALGISRGKLAL